MPRALGDDARYISYQKRVQYWRNLFRDGYVVPRNPDGSYLAGFDPASLAHFVEDNAAQYRAGWVVFDVAGLFRAMGGTKIAIEQLDRHLAELNAWPGSEYGFLGNEPGLETPWISYLRRRALSHAAGGCGGALLSLFRAVHGGMPGNDDGGRLSAWAVFAATGLFPQIPGVGSS